MAIRFDIVTLFPDIFSGFMNEGLLQRAIRNGLVEIHAWNLRDWSHDKHRKVDDRPYGGGPGMVIAPQPVFDAVEEIRGKCEPPGLLVCLTPQGDRLTQPLVEELATRQRLVLLCGRYEGFDERIRLGLKPREISIGDFICNGGEAPAMVLIDAVMRLIPGALGDEESSKEDSHSRPGWMEYPQYTRPPVYRGMAVPEILLGGNHAKIARWRQQQASLRSKDTKKTEIEVADVNESAPGQSPGKQPEGSQAKV